MICSPSSSAALDLLELALVVEHHVSHDVSLGPAIYSRRDSTYASSMRAASVTHLA